MVLIRQTNRHDQMTCTNIELGNNHTGDVKLFKSHFSTLFYFCLILSVLSILQFVGSSCSSVFKLNLSTKNPFRRKLIVESQDKTRDGNRVVMLFGISFLMTIETVNTIILEIGNHLAIASKTELIISNCIWLCGLCQTCHCAQNKQTK